MLSQTNTQTKLTIIELANSIYTLYSQGSDFAQALKRLLELRQRTSFLIKHKEDNQPPRIINPLVQILKLPNIESHDLSELQIITEVLHINLDLCVEYTVDIQTITGWKQAIEEFRTKLRGQPTLEEKGNAKPDTLSINYTLDCITQAIKMLPDNQSKTDMILNIGKNLASAYSLKPDAIKVLNDYRKELSSDWYTDVWLIRRLTLLATKSSKIWLSDLQPLLKELQKSKDWRIAYATQEALGQVIINSSSYDLQLLVFCNSQPYTDKIGELCFQQIAKEALGASRLEIGFYYQCLRVIKQLQEHPIAWIRFNANQLLQEAVQDKQSVYQQIVIHRRLSFPFTEFTPESLSHLPCMEIPVLPETKEHEKIFSDSEIKAEKRILISIQTALQQKNNLDLKTKLETVEVFLKDFNNDELWFVANAMLKFIEHLIGAGQLQEAQAQYRKILPYLKNITPQKRQRFYMTLGDVHAKKYYVDLALKYYNHALSCLSNSKEEKSSKSRWSVPLSFWPSAPSEESQELLINQRVIRTYCIGLFQHFFNYFRQTYILPALSENQWTFKDLNVIFLQFQQLGDMLLAMNHQEVLNQFYQELRPLIVAHQERAQKYLQNIESKASNESITLLAPSHGEIVKILTDDKDCPSLLSVLELWSRHGQYHLVHPYYAMLNNKPISDSSILERIKKGIAECGDQTKQNKKATLGKNSTIDFLHTQSQSFKKEHLALKNWSNNANDTPSALEQYYNRVSDLLSAQCKEIQAILGKPPCDFTVLVESSLGSNLFCPGGQIKIALLIEKSDCCYHPYFASFLSIVELTTKCVSENFIILSSKIADPHLIVSGQVVASIEALITDPIKENMLPVLISLSNARPLCHFSAAQQANPLSLTSTQGVGESLFTKFQVRIKQVTSNKIDFRRMFNANTLETKDDVLSLSSQNNQLDLTVSNKLLAFDEKYIIPLNSWCYSLEFYYGLQGASQSFQSDVLIILDKLVKMNVLEPLYAEDLKVLWIDLLIFRFDLYLAILERPDTHREPTKELTQIDERFKAVVSTAYELITHWFNNKDHKPFEPARYMFLKLQAEQSGLVQANLRDRTHACVKQLFVRSLTTAQHLRIYSELSDEMRAYYYSCLVEEFKSNQEKEFTDSTLKMLRECPHSYGYSLAYQENLNQWYQVLNSITLPVTPELAACLSNTKELTKKFAETYHQFPKPSQPILVEWIQKSIVFLDASQAQQRNQPVEFKLEKRKAFLHPTIQVYWEQCGLLEKGMPGRAIVSSKEKEYGRADVLKVPSVQEIERFLKRHAEKEVKAKTNESKESVLLQNQRTYQSEDIKNPCGFIKFYPEAPARQAMAESLAWSVTGWGPISTLCKFTSLDTGLSYPALLSQPAGEVLQDVLQYKGKKAFAAMEEKLDTCAFTSKFFESMLLMYEDDKFDNVAIRSFINADGKKVFSLVSFDCDRVFADDVIEDKINAKSLLFCMDNMLKPLDKQAVENFLRLDFSQFLSVWLNEQIQLDALYSSQANNPDQSALFKMKEMVDFIYPKPFISQLFAYLEPNSIKALYQRFHRIRAALQDERNQIKTHMDLFAKILPKLASKYLKTFNENHKDSKQRFDALPKNYLDKKTNVKPEGESKKDEVKQLDSELGLISDEGKTTQYITHQTTTSMRKARIGRSLTIAMDKKSNGIKQVISWQQALEKDLKEGTIYDLKHGEAELKEIHAHYAALDEISSQLLKGNLEPFKALKGKVESNYAKEWVVNHLNFSDLPQKSVNQSPKITDNYQTQILKELIGGHYQSLRLANCQALTDDILQKILRHCPELNSLDISGCIQLTEKSFIFMQKCEKLQVLYASGLGLQVTKPYIKLHSLTDLDLRDCKGLNQVELEASQLQSFDISGSHNCQMIKFHELGSMKKNGNAFSADIIFANKTTPVLNAAKKGYFSLLKLLIKLGNNPYSVDYRGRTLLHFAIESLRELQVPSAQQIAMIRFILKLFPSLLNQADTQEGLTPIMLACHKGIGLVFKYLLLYGADVTMLTKDGCSLLWIAADKNHINIVNYLVKNYPSMMDAKNTQHKSPIVIAAKKNHEEILKTLYTCINASSLSFAGCEELTDNGLELILKNLPKSLELNKLDISGCVNLTGQAFRIIETHGQSIQALYANHLPHIKKIVSLKTFYERREYSVYAERFSVRTGTEIVYLPVTREFPISFPNLKVLELKHCKTLSELSLVQSKSLEKVEFEGAPFSNFLECKKNFGKFMQPVTQVRSNELQVESKRSGTSMSADSKDSNVTPLAQLNINAHSSVGKQESITVDPASNGSIMPKR